MNKHGTTRNFLPIAATQMLNLGERCGTSWPVGFWSRNVGTHVILFERLLGGRRREMYVLDFYLVFSRYRVMWYFLLGFPWCEVNRALAWRRFHDCVLSAAIVRSRHTSSKLPTDARVWRGELEGPDSRTAFQSPVCSHLLSTLPSPLCRRLSTPIGFAHSLAHTYCSWPSFSAPFLYECGWLWKRYWLVVCHPAVV